MTFGRPGLFVDLAAELLSRGHRVRFRAPGTSMRPAILDGDAITVEPVRPLKIRADDVLLYRGEQRVFAHRVVGVAWEGEAGAVFALRGDVAGSADERVGSGQILGRVIAVERRNRAARLFEAARLRARRLAGLMERTGGRR